MSWAQQHTGIQLVQRIVISANSYHSTFSIWNDSSLLWKLFIAFLDSLWGSNGIRTQSAPHDTHGRLMRADTNTHTLFHLLYRRSSRGSPFSNFSYVSSLYSRFVSLTSNFLFFVFSFSISSVFFPPLLQSTEKNGNKKKTIFVYFFII